MTRSVIARHPKDGEAISRSERLPRSFHSLAMTTIDSSVYALRTTSAFICVQIVLIFFFLIPQIQAIEVSLSKSEAEQAIGWGEREEKRNVLTKYKFRSATSINEYGYLITKYADLALATAEAKEKGNKLSEGEQEEILAKKDFLIEIHTVGDRIDFAKEYSLVIITSRSVKGKRELEVVAPTKTESDTLAKPKETWPLSPAYEAVVQGFFPYEKLRPGEKITVILVRSRWEEEKELRFEVDLSRYK